MELTTTTTGTSERVGKDSACDGRDAGDGDFSGQGGVSKDLGGGVEVADGIGCDDHDGLLWVTMMVAVAVVSALRERVGKE